MNSFLKYQIFSFTIQLFLNKHGIASSYEYSENEINMTECKSIGLIMDLLNKDENDFATNFSLEEILPRIADIAEISVFIEKIIEMFVDEMKDKRNSQKS